MGRSHFYNTNRAALRARTMQRGDPCARCGKPFQWDVPWWYSWAFTAGHIVDVIDGGGDELDNLQPEHHRCNTSAGAKKGIARAQAQGLPSNLAHSPERRAALDPKSQEWP